MCVCASSSLYLSSLFPSRYTGSIKALLENYGSESIVLPGGVSYVQLIPIQYHDGPILGGETYSRAVRGAEGFGSTSAAANGGPGEFLNAPISEAIAGPSRDSLEDMG